jgi:hypothetical protein
VSDSRWPSVPEGEEWILELLDERFEQTSQSPEELEERAKELRSQAAASDVTGFREAAIALAERYEETALVRSAPK